MVKRITFLLTFIFLFILGINHSEGQELPVLNQKLTSTFLYNPSMAGLDYGSATFIHKKNWSGIAGSPVSNIVSAHLPVARGRVGLGLNYIYDRTNIYSSSLVSAAFAYHIPLTEYTLLSMGVSGEYANVRADASKINVMDESDVLLNELLGNSENNYDFSFGMNFDSRYFALGGAYNRLSSSFLVQKSESFLQDYLTTYLKLYLPLSQRRDLLEPMITYRKLSIDEGLIDAGAYYTYNDLFTIGGSYGNNNQWHAQAGIKYANFYVGYVYESFSGAVNRDLGSNNEIIVRIDFSSTSGYKNKYSSEYENTKKAVSYRRKTLYRPPVGAKNPNKFKRKWRRKNKKNINPNKRYNPKKLYTKKKKNKKYKRRR